jgi:hypothetical protein
MRLDDACGSSVEPAVGPRGQLLGVDAAAQLAGQHVRRGRAQQAIHCPIAIVSGGHWASS